REETIRVLQQQVRVSRSRLLEVAGSSQRRRLRCRQEPSDRGGLTAIGKPGTVSSPIGKQETVGAVALVQVR
ncbi:unnamed protein product, partial [Lampetra fluviatilis]